MDQAEIPPPAGEEAANLRAQEAYSRDERLRSGIAANRFQERRRYGRKNISTDGCGVRKKRRKYRGGTRCASYTHATALSSRSEKRPSSRGNRVTIRFILVDCVHPRAVMVKHPWWKYPAKNTEREREREVFFFFFICQRIFILIRNRQFYIMVVLPSSFFFLYFPNINVTQNQSKQLSKNLRQAVWRFIFEIETSVYMI